MARPHPRTSLAAAVLAAALGMCLAANGCAYFRWRPLALTHVDLMERLAIDGAEGLAAPGRGLQPGDIARFRYPLERASAFAASSRRRFEGAQWVTDFDALLSAYAELVAYLDRARTAAVGPPEAERARALADRVSAAANVVRAQLEKTD